MSEIKTPKRYIYMHLIAQGPQKGRIFYIGIGIKVRPFRATHRNKYWHNIVNKQKGIYDIVIIDEYDGENNWEYLNNYEEAVIKYLKQPHIAKKEVYISSNTKKPKLANLTDGGGGVLGFKRSEKTKQADRERALKRPPPSKETREKISIANKGINNWNYGKPMPQWQKDAISKAHKGKKMSKEFCENQRKNIIEWHKNNVNPMKGMIDDKNPNAKPVICLVTGETYASGTLYRKDTGMRKSTFNCHIKGTWNKKIKNGLYPKVTNKKVQLLENFLEEVI